MRLLPYLLSGASLLCTPAFSAIYAQRDAASGAMVYSNVPPVHTGRSGVVTVAPAAVAVAAVQFPRIGRAEQQQRDQGRQAILNEELAQERQRLQQAQVQGAAADVQHRYRNNIDALQRELARLQ